MIRYIFSRKISLIAATFVVGLLTIVGTPSYSRANATSVTGFNAGRIMDDSVLTNKDSMNADQIQSFLNSKVSSCDTNGTMPASEFGRSDLTHAQYAAAQGWASPPYQCLKDYTQNGQTAAQIIYNATQTYQINPQVLIVLLQKEQALITDTWPLSSQYRSATGYGCPDSSACDSKYYGLTNQVNWAATMFHAIETNSPTWYTPYILGNNYIQYNPVASCGGSTVDIQNRATQALYNYTPYQPNQAALNAGYGTATCGAYGNRNFYLYFSDWFGNPTVPPVYAWSPISQNVYLDAARTTTLPQPTAVAPGQKFYATIKAKNTGNRVWHQSSTHLATSKPVDRSSIFYNSDWLSYNRPAQMSEDSVNPGDIGTFQMSFTTPQQPGQYSEYFNIVEEGVTWLNDPGLYLPVTVAPAREISIYSDSGRTTKLNISDVSAYTNSKLYATIKIINTSSALIPAATNLATTNPNDRSSDLADSSWLSPNRVTKMIGASSLNPGEIGTFNFTLQTPSQTGTYLESFGLVVDGPGGGWLETNTATFTVTSVERPQDSLSGSSKQMSTGESITSIDGRYKLLMQSDGNLVIYSPTRAVWASNTNGKL